MVDSLIGLGDDKMKRRAFMGLAGGAVAWPLLAHAQTPNRIYRLGHIGNSPLGETLTRETTLPELAKLGFVEGGNLVFYARVGEPAAMPGIMREMLAAQPDAIVAIGPAPLAAAGAATRRVPIVGFGAEAVQLGLAASYARPGGNVTGVVIQASDLEGKRLSILHDLVPDRRRVAGLFLSTGNPESEPAIRKAAAELGLELLAFTVATPAEYPAAFAAMGAQGAQALVIGAAPEFQRDSKLLADLALEARLPTVCEWADMARSGCLIGYGPSRTALRKRMAGQIAQIFRGTPPGDIPIEQPTVFEFALNLKIAKSLELNVPVTMLTSAGEVIE